MKKMAFSNFFCMFFKQQINYLSFLTPVRNLLMTGGSIDNPLAPVNLFQKDHSHHGCGKVIFDTDILCL